MKKIVLLVLIFLLADSVNAQTEKQSFELPRGSFGISYNYILSSQKTNTSPSNTLFGGNGHSLRLGLAWDPFGPKTKAVTQTDKRSAALGVAFDLGFQFGKTSTKDLEAFAKSLTVPVGFKITQSNANWNQIVVMAGPALTIAGKGTRTRPIYIVGLTIGFVKRFNPKTIKIDKVGGAVTGARVFDKTESSTSFAWQANVSIPIAKLGKRLNLCLEGGYGFNGGTIGISFRAGYFYENPKGGKGGKY